MNVECGKIIIQIQNITKNKPLNQNKMRNKFRNCLDKGDGGEWYEPYVTNRDVLWISLGTLIICGIIILAFYLINL